MSRNSSRNPISTYTLDDDVASLSSSTHSSTPVRSMTSSNNKSPITQVSSHSMIESYEYDLNHDSSEEDEIYSISSEDEHTGYFGSKLKSSPSTASHCDRFEESEEATLMDMMVSSRRVTQNTTDKRKNKNDGERHFNTRPNSRPSSAKQFSPVNDSIVSSNGTSNSSSQDSMMNMDALAQKELHLRKLNEAINAESKHVLQQAAHIVKLQEKKLEEVGMRQKTTPSRPSSAKVFKTRPSSATAIQAVRSVIDEGNNTPDSNLDQVAEQMGLEAAMKFYKARVKVLEKELEDVSTKFKQADELSRQSESKVKDLILENKKLEKQVLQQQQKFDKQKKELDTMQEKYKNSMSQINEMRKEIEPLKREQSKESARGNSSETKGKDVRLTRALEEIEKYKLQLTKLQKERGDASDSIRRECEKFRQDNKKLERQKQDLVMAFKKQMKLIDILKRQKIHIEAARLLSFTEKEFAETLNWK